MNESPTEKGTRQKTKRAKNKTWEYQLVHLNSRGKKRDILKEKKKPAFELGKKVNSSSSGSRESKLFWRRGSTEVKKNEKCQR